MSEIKRYDMDRASWADGGMAEYPDGQYVLYADHVRELQLVRAAAIVELNAQGGPSAEQIARQKASRISDATQASIGNCTRRASFL